MKKIILLFVLAVFFLFRLNAQTAIDFSLKDCKGDTQNLFTLLNQGKIVVLVYEMQCTGSLKGATNVSSVMNKYYKSNNKIKLMYLDNAGHNCDTIANWISTNSLFPGINIEYSSSYSSPYGMGMPVIVIAGGVNHKTYLVAKDPSDTTSIYNALQNAINDLKTTPVAFDFTLTDCDGKSQNLYSYLDQNNVAVVIYEMQCMGSNKGATNVTNVMNTFYKTNNKIKIMYLDNLGHDCASTANWISTKGFFPGVNFEYSNEGTSPYGSGMPVMVITGGKSHKTYLVSLGFSDTNTIHNAIKSALGDITTAIGYVPQTINSVNLYPNPVSSGKLTLYYNLNSKMSVNADIIDLAGNRVVNSILLNSNEGEIQKVIPVSNLTNGLYFIRIYTEEGVIIKKFTINR